MQGEKTMGGKKHGHENAINFHTMVQKSLHGRTVYRGNSQALMYGDYALDEYLKHHIDEFLHMVERERIRPYKISIKSGQEAQS